MKIIGVSDSLVKQCVPKNIWLPLKLDFNVVKLLSIKFTLTQYFSLSEPIFFPILLFSIKSYFDQNLTKKRKNYFLLNFWTL